jgi:hypothetical protein
MGPDKPDADNAIRIVDPDHYAILVAGDVEDRTAILENTGAADISLDIRRLRPIGLPYLPKPRHYRFASIGNGWVTVEKGLDRAERYHPHDTSLT